MLLLLTPSTAQQQALTAQLADLQNPTSSSYHQWLTPSAYAAQFANSASDVAAVVAWLQSQGFTVAPLPTSRGWIEFSGTAAEVEQAFGTQVRLVSSAQGNRPVLAGTITVPAALAPLVQGLVSLDGVLAVPAMVAPQSLTVTATDLATRTSAATAEALTPNLVAPLLHLDSLQASAINGTGESIAIPARSNVNLADVAAFRAVFGLPAQALSVQPNGVLPGLADDQALATFAASWAGAAAPGAQIVLVPSAATNATDGVDLSLAAIVDGALAHTVVVGYSSCEAGLSAAHQAFYAALYRQAAAEGIAVVAATGDAGASACTVVGSTAPVTSGYAVNGLASTPWDTAIGVAGFSAAGAGSGVTALAGWSPAATGDPVYAGGGGNSMLYATPSWQSQLANLAQGQTQNRLLPDLALPTAIDSSVNRGLAFCLSTSATSSGCNLVRSGGSAAAAAIFGGIASLVAQQHGAQGSLQSNLYALSSKSGIYTDVQQGSTQLACTAGTSGCAATGFIGYNAASGYDLATGLGTVNAQTLVASWATPMNGTASTTLNVSVAPVQTNSTYNPSASITFTAQVLSTSGGATPTGTVVFYDTTTSQSLSLPITLDGTGTGSATLEGVFALGGNEMVAEYSGDANYAAATSNPPININTQASTTSLTVTPSTTTAAPGQSISAVVTLTVGTPAAGTVNPAGVVTLNVDGGQQSYTAALSTTGGVTTASFASVLMPASSTLSTHTLQAVYATSTNYSGSTSPQVTITMAKSATATTVIPPTLTPTAGGSISVTVNVTTSNPVTALPSGTVTLTEDGVTVGTGTLTPGSPSVASIALNLVSAGTHLLAAAYSGDSSYSASNSSTVSISAAQGASVTTVTASPATLTAGKTETLTATVAPVSAASGVTYTLTGTVRFYDGSTLLGAVPVSNNTAVLSGISLANNVSHTITAVYSGDTNWIGSTSAPLPLSATTLPDYVVLTANYAVAPPGVAVVLTATVTPATVSTSEANPTGTVNFYIGTTLIGQAALAAVTGSNSSVATLTTQTLPAGPDSIYAVYQGDSYYDAATSNNLSIVVEDFTITASASNPATNLTIVKGSSGSATFNIAGEGGFNSLIQVVCAVASQDDMTCTASPQQVTPPGTVTFVVQTFTSGTTARKSPPPLLWPRAMGGTALAAIGFLFLPFGRRVRRRLLARAGKTAERGLFLILLLAGLVGSGVGCSNSQQIVTSGTPLGVATLQITATTYVNNTTISHSVYLTVNVVTSD
jgi:subtilase family serine protease